MRAADLVGEKWQPSLLYLPSRLSKDGRHIDHQSGGFVTETEAQQVIDLWRSEGRTAPMRISAVPIYMSVDDWKADNL
jgi:hypothetical protein